MSVIFDTTMAPTKRELMAAWLPGQAWFAGNAVPSLRVVGGFRLDDPAGEVGMEMILVLDEAQETPVLYHVPLSYRGAALEGAEDFLLGTSEHGVLGTRWIYDAAGDPVWQAQVQALVAGDVQAQHQNVSNMLEPTVIVTRGTGAGTSESDVPGRIAAVLRRPVTGGTASTDALAWVNARWIDAAGNGAEGAVLELF